MQELKKQYHIQCQAGDVGEYILMPGDPGRCELIAQYLDRSTLVMANREYTTYTGYLNETKVSVVSSGIGGASTAIAIEELVNIGAKTIIRVGTCGGMQPDVEINDVVLANSAIRFDGTSKEYMPIEFPAVADYRVLNALVEAAGEYGSSYHVGVVHCKDSFFGQHEAEKKPIRYELLNKWQAWIEGGTLASEMESSTLFVLGSILGVRTGTVLAVAGNIVRVKKGLSNPTFKGTDIAIKIAIDAVKSLVEEDVG